MTLPQKTGGLASRPWASARRGLSPSQVQSDPVVFGETGCFIESHERVEHGVDLGVIETAQDHLAARPDEGTNGGAARCQHPARKVCEHEIGGGGR